MFGNFAGIAASGAPSGEAGRLGAVESTAGAAEFLPPPSTLVSWKPTTASRITELTARIFFWRWAFFWANALTVLVLVLLFTVALHAP